jgi:hypothetical protein
MGCDFGNICAKAERYTSEKFVNENSKHRLLYVQIYEWRCFPIGLQGLLDTDIRRLCRYDSCPWKNPKPFFFYNFQNFPKSFWFEIHCVYFLFFSFLFASIALFLSFWQHSYSSLLLVNLFIVAPVIFFFLWANFRFTTLTENYLWHYNCFNDRRKSWNNNFHTTTVSWWNYLKVAHQTVHVIILEIILLLVGRFIVYQVIFSFFPHACSTTFFFLIN